MNFFCNICNISNIENLKIHEESDYHIFNSQYKSFLTIQQKLNKKYCEICKKYCNNKFLIKHKKSLKHIYNLNNPN